MSLDGSKDVLIWCIVGGARNYYSQIGGGERERERERERES